MAGTGGGGVEGLGGGAPAAAETSGPGPVPERLPPHEQPGRGTDVLLPNAVPGGSQPLLLSGPPLAAPAHRQGLWTGNSTPPPPSPRLLPLSESLASDGLHQCPLPHTCPKHFFHSTCFLSQLPDLLLLQPPAVT